MIRIAIVEDEQACAQKYRKKIQQTDFRDEVSVDLYLAPKDFLDSHLAGKQYQLCFFDIMMPGMNGIQLAEEIRKTDSRTLIVFLTSYQEYATEGYNVDAFGYLIKGREAEGWDRLVGRVLARLEADREKIYRVITPNGAAAISVDDIIYIYKSGNYSRFVLVDREEEIAVRKSLYKIEEELRDHRHFIHIKRGFIINIKRIKEYLKNEVLMANGVKIPIGRMHTDKVKEKVMDYMEGMS